MKKICISLIGILIFSQTAYALTDEPVFQLTVAVPKFVDHGERVISKRYDGKPEFHVILKNVSDKPQKVWSEDCSWGVDNLKLEIEMDGQKKLVEKAQVVFGKNVPKYWTLLPGESFIFDILAGSGQYIFPDFKEASKTVKLKAIYRNESKDAFGAMGPGDDFWTGQIESEPLDVVIYKWWTRINSKAGNN